MQDSIDVSQEPFRQDGHCLIIGDVDLSRCLLGLVDTMAKPPQDTTM